MAKNTSAAAAAATQPNHAADAPTPDNTPVPGGGRWRWDITKPGWVDLDAVPTEGTTDAAAAAPSAAVSTATTLE